MKEEIKILICGFSKSGTTIIAKTFSYCVDLNWQNEVKPLWGISNYANFESAPDGSVAKRVFESKQWESAKEFFRKTPIIKFPEGILILSLFPKTTNVICVIRNPLDTFCAYLERKHEFKTVNFSMEEIIKVAKDWNYQILSIGLAQRPICFICYEKFIDNPEEAIKKIAYFCGLEIKKSMPDWVSEQAQEYKNLVPSGQQIRGPGRFKLSIQNKNVISQVIALCYPALNYLKKQGIEYDFNY